MKKTIEQLREEIKVLEEKKKKQDEKERLMKRHKELTAATVGHKRKLFGKVMESLGSATVEGGKKLKKTWEEL